MCDSTVVPCVTCVKVVMCDSICTGVTGSTYYIVACIKSILMIFIYL